MIVNLNVRNRRVLILGAGPVGLRRALRFAEEGAVVRLVGPIMEGGAEGIVPKSVEWEQRLATLDDLVWRPDILVIACDSRECVEIAEAAEKMGVVWINRADDAESGTLSVLASQSVEGGQIAVAGGDAGPVYARWILEQAVEAVEPEVRERVYGVLAEARKMLKSTGQKDAGQVLGRLLEVAEQREISPEEIVIILQGRKL